MINILIAHGPFARQVRQHAVFGRRGWRWRWCWIRFGHSNNIIVLVLAIVVAAGSHVSLCRLLTILVAVEGHPFAGQLFQGIDGR